MTVLTAISCSFGLYNQSVAQNQLMPALNSKQLDQINNQPLIPAVPEPANAYGPTPGQLNRGPAPDPDAIPVLGSPLSGPGSETPLNLQPLKSGETNILNIPFN